MAAEIALAVAAAIILAYFLPEAWARLGWRRPLAAPAAVALTFDDGPDPATTPLVLDLLAELDVKATFFVLTERAAAHPELLCRMRDAGHEVALHGRRHRHHWLMAPWAIAADVTCGRDELTALLGEPPRLLRPPWGMLTLATLGAVRGAGLQLALYEVESGDWLPLAPDAIAARIVARTRPGSVVLLHDAARDRAQVERTVAALRRAVPQLRARGLEFAPMSEMMPPPKPRLLVRAWIAWEHLFARLAGALPITENIHIVPYKYSGPPRRRDGATVLQRGDRCLDIHFNSEVLYTLPGHAGARWGSLISYSSDDMALIARRLRDGEFPDVRAVTAITLFHRPATRLGFRADPIEPAWRRRFFTWYMGLIKRVYQGTGSAMAREARFIWMTREEFIANLLKDGD